MGSIREGSVMENMWLVFEFGGNYKSAQIFATASCGPPYSGYRTLHISYIIRVA